MNPAPGPHSSLMHAYSGQTGDSGALLLVGWALFERLQHQLGRPALDLTIQNDETLHSSTITTQRGWVLRPSPGWFTCHTYAQGFKDNYSAEARAWRWCEHPSYRQHGSDSHSLPAQAIDMIPQEERQRHLKPHVTAAAVHHTASKQAVSTRVRNNFFIITPMDAAVSLTGVACQAF